MEIIKQTLSVCPTCIKEIPATIIINNDGVIMHKTCSEHGPAEVLIERDPVFYMLCELQGCKEMYSGSFICITMKCNANCKYCYFPVDNASVDRSIEDILKECRTINRQPYMLTGGDPTMRDDLPELLTAIHKIGRVAFATNGIKLADDKYLGRLLGSGMVHDGTADIGISLHPEANNLHGEYSAKIQAIENFVRRGVSMNLLFTIDKLSQIDEYIDILDQYRGTVWGGVIGIAAAAGCSKNVVDPIFISEAYYYLAEKAKREGKPFSFATHGNSVASFTTIFDGYHIQLAKLRNKYDIDLDDLNCEPVAMCRDGRVVHSNYALVRHCS